MLLIKRFFQAPETTIPADVSLLLIRVVSGFAFILHGWGKIQNPTGWMGEDAGVPGIFQALAAISEFGGGITWILGLLTPLASLGILCTMAVAFSMHAFVRGDPFIGGSELAAVYFCVAFLLFMQGPGMASLDRLIFGRREP